MKTYDPLEAPDPLAWSQLDEGARIDMIVEYHRREGVAMASPRGHAIIHVVVEHQAAMGGDLPVRESLERLVAEGLDRHEAIHAVGSVLGQRLQDTLSRTGTTAEVIADYARRLADLTAESWRKRR